MGGLFFGLKTCLAAALSAIDIPLSEKPFARVVGDGIRGERVAARNLLLAGSH